MVGRGKRGRGMTQEETIDFLNEIKYGITPDDEHKNRLIDALDVAIKSLENQKTGHWIEVREEDDCGNMWYMCSECTHGDIHAKTQVVPYCWWCGSRMESEGEE